MTKHGKIIIWSIIGVATLTTVTLIVVLKKQKKKKTYSVKDMYSGKQASQIPIMQA